MAQTQRYWDGAQWTGHIAPITAAPAPSDHGPATAEHWLIPVGRSWQSITAGYLGFLCLVIWFVPVLGFAVEIATAALGVWALRLAKQGGHGRGRAVFGIVCAGLGFVGSILALAAGGPSRPLLQVLGGARRHEPDSRTPRSPPGCGRARPAS